jgi:hypothetical protein
VVAVKAEAVSAGQTRPWRKGATTMETVTAYETQKLYLTPFPTEKLIAKLEKYARKSLTCTSSNGTFVALDGNDMDATALRLVQRLKELEEQQGRLTRERQAIMTALTVAGVRPEGPVKGMPGFKESDYHMNRTFKGRSLPASCEIALKDHKGQWLSKSEIEYLIVQGEYEFSTGNPKNSIGITLQRMAEEGLCEVQRVRGQQGNRYRWPSEEVKKK